ncbi:hypothetical protein [Nocardioides cynanchi]|uniref:hypothetical protein n=1 Tax=Nocardioides cynanchi TaxID=2558918 RepID=UPI00124537A0|nr:hypothetical protein [Nocardioides cynanchi]
MDRTNAPGRRMSGLVVLALALLLMGSGAAAAWTTAYGHLRSRDGVLRPGCHPHHYHYVVKPGSPDWTLETWLYDPRGRPRGAGDLYADADPASGRAAFAVCRPTVVPGRFTITARLRWYTPGQLPTDPPVQHTRWFEPAHFRLSRR